ncbi:MAG: glycosyltransferase family 9 protein [Mucilaginibacter sp.]
MFRITRLTLLKLPLLLKFFAKFRVPRKRLLIIKTDAIGDYILFRNFLEIVRSSEEFRDYQIDLLGNALWQDIAVKYDSQFIDGFIFVKPDTLYEAPLSVLKLALQLFKANYATVLLPTYSRTFISDGLAVFTAAKQIIGFESDTERIPFKYKKKTDRFFTKKLILPPGTCFEFERSRFFFESILSKAISLNATFIPTSNGAKKGVVVFPGAGVLKRGWEMDRFSALLKLIKQHTAQPVYLAGGAAELSMGEQLTSNLPSGSVINLIGKSTLPQLIELVGNATLIVANETSAIHIAVATKTRSVCILGGGHFERFSPYPEYFEYRPVCIYEKLKCYYCNWDCIYDTAADKPFPCISIVRLDTVWDAVRPLLAP